MSELITFTIDERQITVPKGTTVYKACKQMGIDIPIFCYQDRMPPFGACRVCLVEVEKVAKPQTSCTLVATEGMVVKTQSQLAKEGREQILEFLLINHPLDCPICDRGGECPLQDQVVEFGPGKSRFYEDKRRFSKPHPLGPVLMLDRERCIACARCTRFGDIVAGDHALEFIERGYKTEVGTPDGGPAQSKFIGNTIQICPVGALTSNVYRFRARPWDNTPTKTICTLCPVGCSMILDSRDGEIMRTRSCENKDINDIWLCDKGWFGYEFSSSRERLKQPLIRRNGVLEPTSWHEALDFIAAQIEKSKPHGRLAGFGGDTLTVEENQLFQQLLGTNHLDHRVGMPLIDLHKEGIAPGMEISISECSDLPYIVLLGVDLTEEFPIIWLRIKEAINKGAQVLYFGHYLPETARYFTKTILNTPGTELEILDANLSDIKGAIFVGRQYLATEDRQAILAKILPLAESINILEGRGNSMGARFAHMHPQLHETPGLNALEVLTQPYWDYLHVAGCDVARKVPKELWQKARCNLKFLVVQELFMTQTAVEADVVLPVLSFVEKEGTFINIEGRVEHIYPGKTIPTNVLSDGEVFTRIADILGHKIATNTPTFDRLSSVRPETIYVPQKAQTSDGLKATFAPVLFDGGNRMKHNDHLVQMAKEPRLRIHPRVGFADGSIVSVSGKFSAKITHDENVAHNTVVIPLGFDEIPVYELSDNLLNGISVELTR